MCCMVAVSCPANISQTKNPTTLHLSNQSICGQFTAIINLSCPGFYELISRNALGCNQPSGKRGSCHFLSFYSPEVVHLESNNAFKGTSAKQYMQQENKISTNEQNYGVFLEWVQINITTELWNYPEFGSWGLNPVQSLSWKDKVLHSPIRQCSNILYCIPNNLCSKLLAETENSLKQDLGIHELSTLYTLGSLHEKVSCLKETKYHTTELVGNSNCSKQRSQ